MLALRHDELVPLAAWGWAWVEVWVLAWLQWVWVATAAAVVQQALLRLTPPLAQAHGTRALSAWAPAAGPSFAAWAAAVQA